MNHKLEDMKKDENLQAICDLKKDFIKIMESEVHSKGVNDLDAKECGEVVDMIKDLAEAEKYCMEACYYKKIICAMEDAENEDEVSQRMGYNHNHYANGRFAPKGRGKRMGYIPYDMMDENYIGDYINDPKEFKERMRMGYENSDSRSQTGSTTRMGFNEDDYDWDPDRDPRQSKTYNEYKKAKRHYTETKSPEAKKEMDEKGIRHMNEAIDTFRDMWKDADPNMRKRMKADLTSLIGEMPT